MSGVRGCMSCVTCHMSPVMCRVSHVSCHLSLRATATDPPVAKSTAMQNRQIYKELKKLLELKKKSNHQHSKINISKIKINHRGLLILAIPWIGLDDDSLKIITKLIFSIIYFSQFHTISIKILSSYINKEDT